MELSDRIYNKIKKLCSLGDKLAENGNYEKAILQYNKALRLLPSPPENWEACTWIYVAIGDALFLKREYNNSMDYFFKALRDTKSLDNPFIYLRIGECFFEILKKEKSFEYLLKAYMIDGDRIFENEETKYYNFLKEKMTNT